MPLILTAPYKKIVKILQTIFTVLDASTMGNGTLSEGDLKFTGLASSGARSKISKSSGKWYWECTVNYSTSLLGLGVVSENTTAARPWNDKASSSCIAYYRAAGGNNLVYKNGNLINSNFGPNLIDGATVGIALDLDNMTIQFYPNGRASHGAVSIDSSTYFAYVGDGGGDKTVSCKLNFGATPFRYTVPAGFNAGLY